MYSTAYNLWIFTWFVHFELSFRLKGNEKISILFGCIGRILFVRFLHNFRNIFNTFRAKVSFKKVFFSVNIVNIWKGWFKSLQLDIHNKNFSRWTEDTDYCFINKENRIYIRVEFRQSLGMNFFSPFQPERGFKVYKSCKCSQIICCRVY